MGRLALCRVVQGTIRRAQQVAWCRADGTIERAKVTELYVTEALDRVEAEEAGPGEIIAVAGIPEVTIGETLADPDDPRPLPVFTVDEPSLSMTVGINTSPLAGREGDKVTASSVEARLRAELVGNVSLRVLPTERPDTWEVQGRGELQLEVLVEQMRREGFELTIGKPQVVTRLVDGKVHEPVERVSVDVPEEYLGVVTQLFALRKGRTEALVNHGTGWVRMEVLVPARGLIGFRTEFLTETRGTGILHHVFDRFEPWHGELRTRPTGGLVADRSGKTTAFALLNLQERGSMFVGPGVDVYEGMIVGENARADDLDVNATKEKKLTNMRSSTSDELVRLIPPRPLPLDQALEFIRDDECVEVTPTERAPAQDRAFGPEAPDRDEPQGSWARARLIGYARAFVGEHMTQDQHDQLATELAELEGPRRKKLVEAIATAREEGDLSENFEYHAAKNEQGLLERKITILRARLEDAEIVDGRRSGRGLGRLDGRDQGRRRRRDGGRDLGSRR